MSSERLSSVLRLWTAMFALFGSLLACGAAHADDEPPPIRLRASVAGGVVLSADQQSELLLDLPVVEGQVRAGWAVLDVLVLELALSGGAFFSSELGPGALLDLALGAEAGIDAGVARPWLALHLGAGLTGDLFRPVLRITAGVDVRASREIALGPVLGYGHVFQEDGLGFTDDAQFISLGLSLTWRPARAEPPPPPVRPPHRERRPPPPPPPPPPPEPTEELMVLIDEAAGTRPRELLVPVLFAYDSTQIVACTLPSLHALREHLDAHPEIRLLEIEGHADGNGSEAYNDALSLRRAEAIRDWLVARGVAPERLRVAARGERAPVEGNEDDAGREQNRRARFRVLMEGQ